MDRNRLKEVHQSDLTESRINEDFLSWIKNQGPTYLLILLVCLCTYILLVRWNEQKQNHITTAWAEYLNSRLPGSLEEVADKYSDVGALPQLARLRAAQLLLTSVQTGQALGDEGGAQVPLSIGERTNYLDRADNLYSIVIGSDDRSSASALVTINALYGRAAVAEARGEFDQARLHLEATIERARTVYPRLATQAQNRIDSMDLPMTLATFSSVAPPAPIPNSDTARTRLRIDPALADLISPNNAPIAPLGQ